MGLMASLGNRGATVTNAQRSRQSAVEGGGVLWWRVLGVPCVLFLCVFVCLFDVIYLASFAATLLVRCQFCDSCGIVVVASPVWQRSYGIIRVASFVWLIGPCARTWANVENRTHPIRSLGYANPHKKRIGDIMHARRRSTVA